jgi:hypothetical protein
VADSRAPSREAWSCRTGTALENAVRHDYPIYAERYYGINLRWYTDVVDAEDAVTTANAYFGYRTGLYGRHGTGRGCSAHIVWQLTPVSLTGSTGISDPVTIRREFDESAVYRGSTGWWCEFRTFTGNLRTGIWRVDVAGPVWTATCTRHLVEGVSIV